MKTFDALIIGSGQAGTPLAFRLSKAGKKVAMIEKEHYGGTCVNDGCTPTKAYVASARRIWAAKNAADLGILVGEVRADLKAIKARKDALVAGSRDGIRDGLAADENISTFYGKAVFTGHKEVMVNEERLQAEQVFINVGGRPRIPESFQAAYPLTNKTILQLDTLPEHLVIAGGGYIGLEFGQMFARFGAKVTIVERKDRIIPKEDPEVSQAIQEALEADGVEFRLEANCLSARKTAEGGVAVQVDCREGAPEVTGSHLLLALGRSPNTDELFVMNTGLETDEQGYLPVDDHGQTAVAGIFALGDCNGQGGFTHTSYHDFQVVEDFLFGQGRKKISDRITTYGLFVDPPLGRVGLSLNSARETGKTVRYEDMPMEKVARAREKGETRGFMRVIVDAKDRIVGAHILGPGGDELISTMSALMYAGTPYTVFRDSVQVHPTVAELLPTLMQQLSE